MNEKGFDQTEWRPLHAIDKARLSEARLQAHYAAQWLARAARAYVPPQPDDGHTSLSLDRALDEFVTHPFKNGMRFSLQMTNLSLTLRDRDGAAVVESIFLNGRSDSQVRQSLGDKLSKLNLDARALDTPSPYEIPAHAIAQGSHYDAIGSAAALTELAAWFSNAELLLDRIQGQLIGRKLAVSSVCCWPHHFDLATLTTLRKRDFDAISYLGVGLSPGDIYYDEPYFYVICVSKTRFNNASNLADVRPLAHTRIHGRYWSGSQYFIGNRTEDRGRRIPAVCGRRSAQIIELMLVLLHTEPRASLDAAEIPLHNK